MESCEVLEAQVAVVATLGELVATMTAPCRIKRLFMYPASLHDDLRRFTWTLRDTLRHPDFTCLGFCDVTSVYQPDVTELGRALAALRDTRWGTLVHVRAAARALRESVDELVKSWFRVAEEALELRDTWEKTTTDEGTNEDTDEDTSEDSSTAQAGDLRGATTGWGTAGDNLVAAAQQLLVSLPSVVAAHKAPMAAATKAMEEAMVAISQVGTATRRLRVEKVQGLLEHLVAACDRATMFPRGLQR
ncbi:uncharacterized protein LOC134565405 [Prinia subflava]|uniref:uncharacterized protein LOC134565405 n=1 Tax=Prinia subflava TaxID=208062 RepID=UPI002FE327BE